MADAYSQRHAPDYLLHSAILWSNIAEIIKALQ